MRLAVFSLLALGPSLAFAQPQAPERSPFTGAPVGSGGSAGGAEPGAVRPLTTSPAGGSAADTSSQLGDPAPQAALSRAALPKAEPTPSRSSPEARTGFQMHVVPMLAVTFPFGDATAEPGDSLDARYGWQWMPLELGLGLKLTKELYLGGYFNVAVGAEGDDLHTEGRCEAGQGIEDDVSCSASSVRLGLEVRYTFAAAERMSGWIGYGAGITSATQTISDAGRYSESSTAQGLEWARLSGGLDFRVSRGFGLGPFVVASIGRFEHQRTEIGNRVTFSGDIERPALHAWLSVGLRLVIFP